MRRVKAKVLLGFVIVLGLVIIITVFMNPERRIFFMVEKNQTEYEAVAVQLLSTGEPMEVKGVGNIKVLMGDHAMVDFYVTGFGLAPSSTYYGFFYSPDDVPLAIWNIDVELTEYAEDEWKWTEYGDNRGVTKKIVDGWYYYEASF